MDSDVRETMQDAHDASHARERAAEAEVARLRAQLARVQDAARAIHEAPQDQREIFLPTLFAAAGVAPSAGQEQDRRGPGAWAVFVQRAEHLAALGPLRVGNMLTTVAPDDRRLTMTLLEEPGPIERGSMFFARIDLGGGDVREGNYDVDRHSGQLYGGPEWVRVAALSTTTEASR